MNMPGHHPVSAKIITRLHALIIFGVGFLAWSNSFHAPFVFDDLTAIVNNQLIRNLYGFFSDPAVFEAVPRRFFGYLSFAVNYRLGGLTVEWFHAVNLALHLFASLSLYAVCSLLLQLRSESGRVTQLVPLSAALFFAAHPVQTQAVTYVTQRFTLLATLFYLLTIFAYCRSKLIQGTGSALWYGSACAFAICAIMSKEIAITLPIALLLLECSFFRNDSLKYIPRLVPFLAISSAVAIYLLLTAANEPEIMAIGTVVSGLSPNMAFHSYLITQAAVFSTYLRLLVLPVNQTLDYDYPMFKSLTDGPVVWGIFLILLCIMLAIYLFRRSANHYSRLIAFGTLIFMLSLSVEALIPLSDLINEHRLYLPSIGASLAAAGLIGILSDRIRQRSLEITIGILVTIMAIVTWQRNLVWSDDLLLWSDAAAKAPAKARPHYNLGIVLSNRGDWVSAGDEFAATLVIDPEHARARYNLGVVKARRGDLHGAQKDYTEALRLDSNLAEAYNSLGTLLSTSGEILEAIPYFRKAVQLAPGLADAHNNLGAAFAASGDLDNAQREVEAAVRISPTNASYRENLAKVYGMKGLEKESGEQLRIVKGLCKKQKN